MIAAGCSAQGRAAPKPEQKPNEDNDDDDDDDDVMAPAHSPIPSHST